MRSDLTLVELRTWLRAERAVFGGHDGAVARTAAPWPDTQNSCGTRPSRTAPTLSSRARRGVPNSRLTPARPVFLDETWASTNMTRHYGRSPRGHEQSIRQMPSSLVHE